MFEGLRSYLQLASGLTEVSRQRAMAAARSLISQSGAGAEQVLPNQVLDQVASLADDLVATSRANRDLLLTLVRTEVERSIPCSGLVTSDDFTTATRRALRLERRLNTLEDQAWRQRRHLQRGAPGDDSSEAIDRDKRICARRR